MEHKVRTQNFLSFSVHKVLVQKSQFDAYKARKKLLHKRIRFGIIGMCVLIIILIWLQDYLPAYNKRFWSRGEVCNLQSSTLEEQL